VPQPHRFLKVLCRGQILEIFCAASQKSLRTTALHQYKLDEDETFLTKMYNEEDSFDEISLEEFIKLCMKLDMGLK
jgi:hypothetical protein